MIIAARAIAAALIAPIASFSLSAYVMGASLGSDYAQIFGTLELCAQGLPYANACSAIHGAPTLAISSVAAAIFGLLILGGYTLVAKVCGSNRIALSIVFPALTFLALLAVAGLSLAHAGLIAGALFVAESHWFGEVHGVILWGIAALGFITAFGVAWAAVRSFGPASISVIGMPITPMDEPRLMLMVANLSRAMGVRPPDNVVVGMEPNFFVTKTTMTVPAIKFPLKGRTLFLSAPLMRALSIGELKAIIAHELAHFGNNDVAYSERFAPVYARLQTAGGGASANRPSNPFQIAAQAFTEFMVSAFHRNVMAVSRKRELAADRIASAHASTEDFGYALLKVSLLNDLWQREVGAMIQRVSQGRLSRNLSLNFADQIRYDIDRNKVADVMASLMAWHMPHPTDSHPATDERLVALGLDIPRLVEPDHVHARMFREAPAAEVLDDMKEIEEYLTFVYQKMIVEGGLAIERESHEAEELLHRLVVDFIAHVITADGIVRDEEIEIAEKEAARFIGDFDPRELRESCRHPDSLMDLDRLSELALILLTPSGFRNLSALLQRVADADGMRHKRETVVIRRVRATAELAQLEE